MRKDQTELWEQIAGLRNVQTKLRQGVVRVQNPAAGLIG